MVRRIVAKSLPAPSAAPRSRWRLWVGLGAALSIDGLYSGALDLGFAYRPLPFLRLEAELLTSVLPRHLSQETGSAEVGWLSLRGSVLFEPWSRYRVSPAFGLGVGALYLWAVGDADVGYHDQSDGAVAFVASATVRLGIRLTRRLRLSLSAAVGLPLPAISVRFAGSPVAGTDRVMVDALAALEIAL